ncbi:MAG: class E sortase [Microcella sp.]|nr:class E sortase [Microcella sp.]
MIETDRPDDGFEPEQSDVIAPATRREARELERAQTTRARSSKTTSEQPARAGAPAKITVVGVLGEVLITAGVVVMLFLGWYIWLDDIMSGSEQQVAAVEVQEQWQTEWERAEAVTERPTVDNGEPVVAQPPAAGEVFATLIVPRFGDDYVRKIAGGIDLRTVLNSRTIGVGHYPDTQMPGEMGNFAIAAHRNTYGGAFSDIDKLRVGDLLYVETADGWYEYAFRGLEYVWPTYVSVLEPVPREPDVAATDRFLTLTSCNPRYSSAERIIAYAVMENWYPRAGGPPAALSGLVEAVG